jgi:hypothetical protein
MIVFHYCPVKYLQDYLKPLFYYVPTGLLNSVVTFHFYRYSVPDGTVPEGQYIGRKEVAVYLKVP